MLKKTEKLKQIEKIIWNNLNTEGIITGLSHTGEREKSTLLKEIVGHSYHGHTVNLEVFKGVDIWTEYNLNTITRKRDIWIDPRVVGAPSGIMALQPVSTKIYRLTDDEEIQRKICSLLWKDISKTDIKQIAFESADEYHRGDRYLDISGRISMDEFYSAISRGDIEVALCPKNAGYRVHLRGFE